MEWAAQRSCVGQTTYWHTSAFAKARASNADIVVIMLERRREAFPCLTLHGQYVSDYKVSPITPSQTRSLAIEMLLLKNGLIATYLWNGCSFLDRL